jgi:hypothetical protein
LNQLNDSSWWGLQQRTMDKERRTTEYLCIAPDDGEKLYDYYNGVLGEAEARRFEEHLALCFRCQDRLLKLDWITKTLSHKAAECFPPQIEKNEGVTGWTGDRVTEDDTVIGEHPVVTPSPRHPVTVSSPRPLTPSPQWWQARWPYALAASFFIVGLSLGGWLISVRRQLAEQKQAVDAAQKSLEDTRRQLEDIVRRSGQNDAQIAELRQTIGQLSQPQLNIPIEDIDPRRVSSRQGHAGAARTIDVPSGVNFFTLILNLVEPPTYARYAIEILDQRGTVAWQGRGLQKTPYNTFTLALSRPLFPAGHYRINLYGLRGSRKELVEEYAVRIRYR